MFPNRHCFGENKDREEVKIEDTDEEKALQNLVNYGNSKSDLIGPAEGKID